MMAKPKSKDIGILPPAIFDLKTVSTTVRALSEASIDTKGYDPAWDDPNFCKTQPDPHGDRIAIDNDGQEEPDRTDLPTDGDGHNGHSTIPENPGHSISFGKTLDALLSGGKSVTRRTWSRRHAEHFIRRFDRGWKCQAFDKDRRYGGQLVGWLRLTQKPYQERLGELSESDVAAEGYPELSKAEFLDRFFEGNADLTVWVIRFEFTPLEVEPSPAIEKLSPSANADESPEPAVVEVPELGNCQVRNSELRIPNSEKDPRWNPEEFGELEFVPESDGQLTIATQDREPPDPDDYPTVEDYERAWANWLANREASDRHGDAGTRGRGEDEYERVSQGAALVAAQVVEADPTAIDGELSYDEKRDRLHLERKVERAFYDAGRALRQLRDRRLYRSSHQTFENYCRDRFGFQRAHSYRLIEAAQVVDNLACLPEENPNNQMSPNGRQNPAEENLTTNGRQNPAQTEMSPNSAQTKLLTNGYQILPTSERQIRPLAKLEPDRQREVWQQAVTEAGGKVPSGRIVKDIVERMQHVESPPEQPPRAHHLTLQPWGLVEVSCPSEKIHARLGRIATVREKTVEVWLRDVETMIMVKHTLKHHQVEAVPMDRMSGLQELCDRYGALRERGLDPFELEVLALLERAVALTPVELGYLEGIEKRVCE